ncbi:hypothetical protein [Solirubrobacter deserti]|uniref:DUF4439 domain-containing protein n=1 Tax=Solirubrobacter deserti TaxID=2282478 RepID=A0ABT4RUH2_9ACTN|nr:hypothetical protein [Solirubrobacter deserti]MDA0142233.1 hypothetical protein [Solirubrobacter deserti]
MNAAQVWGEQLRAVQRAIASYPASAGMLETRARERLPLLESMAAAAGATPTATTPSLQTALEAERLALQTHVAAVGLLEDRASRELLATLIAAAAEAVSALRLELDEPAIVDAFPGQRNRP